MTEVAVKLEDPSATAVEQPTDTAEDQDVSMTNANLEPEQLTGESVKQEPPVTPVLAHVTQNKEDELLEDENEDDKLPSIPVQVLQNVKDLKQEIMNGNHPTVPVPLSKTEKEEVEEGEMIGRRVDQVVLELKNNHQKQITELEQVEKAAESGETDMVQEQVDSVSGGVKRDATTSFPNELQEEPHQDPKPEGERESKRIKQDHYTSPSGTNRQERRLDDSQLLSPEMKRQSSRSNRSALSSDARGRRPDERERDGSARSFSHNNSRNNTRQDDRNSVYSRRRRSRDGLSDRYSTSNSFVSRTTGDRVSERRAGENTDRTSQYEQTSAYDARRNRDRETDFPPARESYAPSRRSLDGHQPEPALQRLALRDRIEGLPPRRASPAPRRMSPPPVSEREARYPLRDQTRNNGYSDRRGSVGGNDRYPDARDSGSNDLAFERMNDNPVSRTGSMPERNAEYRSFPPRGSNSYVDIRGPPPGRPYPAQTRESPPTVNSSKFDQKPMDSYRDAPPRANVTYSRPPAPRDLGPGAGIPPSGRRGYESLPPPAVGQSPSQANPRPYGYGPNARAGPPAPDIAPHPIGSNYSPAGRSGYDRYAPVQQAPAPVDDYRDRDRERERERERERAPEYRAPPPPANTDRYYNAPPPVADPYARASYERQAPSYDRYGRPIPPDPVIPGQYESPVPSARSHVPYAAPLPQETAIDAELMDLKARMDQLVRRREAEKMAPLAAAPPPMRISAPNSGYQTGPLPPVDSGYPNRGPPITKERDARPPWDREPPSMYPPRGGANVRREPGYGPPPGGHGGEAAPPPRNAIPHRGMRRSPPPFRDDRSRR